MAQSGTAVSEAMENLAGKYLIFYVGDEEFGMTVSRIREILPVQDVVPLPEAPGYIRGVVNLRGNAVAVMDLRRKFGLARFADTDRTCLIVAEVLGAAGPVRMGIVVDGVAEVRRLGEGEPAAAPLLDIDRLLTGSELEAFGPAGW